MKFPGLHAGPARGSKVGAGLPEGCLSRQRFGFRPKGAEAQGVCVRRVREPPRARSPESCCRWSGRGSRGGTWSGSGSWTSRNGMAPLSGGKFREHSRFSSKWTHQTGPPGTPRAAVKWQRAPRTVLDARGPHPGLGVPGAAPHPTRGFTPKPARAQSPPAPRTARPPAAENRNVNLAGIPLGVPRILYFREPSPRGGQGISCPRPSSLFLEVAIWRPPRGTPEGSAAMPPGTPQNREFRMCPTGGPTSWAGGLGSPPAAWPRIPLGRRRPSPYGGFQKQGAPNVG